MRRLLEDPEAPNPEHDDETVVEQDLVREYVTVEDPD